LKIAYLNPPHLYFASPLGMTSSEFRQDFDFSKIQSQGYRMELFVWS